MPAAVGKHFRTVPTVLSSVCLNEKVRKVVGAPAFMRGKERFSAPGKSLDLDHAL